METKQLTKRQVQALLVKHGIEGVLAGKGTAWEVELKDEKARRLFRKHVGAFGGFKTGYGAWILRPGYRSDPYAYSNPASRSHY